jgi:hypothetical protein
MAKSVAAKGLLAHGEQVPLSPAVIGRADEHPASTLISNTQPSSITWARQWGVCQQAGVFGDCHGAVTPAGQSRRLTFDIDTDVDIA